MTTVLGNLVDNAIDAATPRRRRQTVEVELLQDGSTLHITVADSGDGVAPGFVDDVFVEGRSTKPDSGIPGGRGIGMGCRGNQPGHWVATRLSSRAIRAPCCAAQSSSPGCRA